MGINLGPIRIEAKTLKEIADGMIDRRSYWSIKNYYADSSQDFGAMTFRSWDEFHNEDWTAVDSDWSENLICGWFLEDLEGGQWQLIVYCISPKKGRFNPLVIGGLSDEDAPKIHAFIDSVRKKQMEHWSIRN